MVRRVHRQSAVLRGRRDEMTVAAVLAPASFRATAGDALLEALAAGEAAALGTVYDAHHDHVRAFARRVVGEDDAAEDLVHETFLALPRAVRGFRGGSALRTFILSVAANHARHHVRAAARRRAMHERSAETPPSMPSPELEAQRRELAVALASALDVLPLEQRLAVVLCEVEERTSAEAAEILDVPEATVRTRVFHAKRKLRELLERRKVR